MPSSIYIITEHIIQASHIREYARATSNSQDTPLSLHIKQYVPRSNPNPQQGDVTIIGAHANGFPKELYEPLWEDFYSEAREQGVRIRAIWMLDVAWQGQSGVLNEGKLGNDPSWLDYARDVLHMINTFRMPQPLVAVGHSFGANALVNTSLMHPRLFTTIVLLDPTISRFAATPESLHLSPAARSIYRRDVWPSRREAAESFRKSPFYKSWDPRALDLWIKYGLRCVSGEGDNDNVTLTTTKGQEVFTYLRPSWPAYDEQGKHVIDPDQAPELDTALGEKYPTFPFYRPEGANTIRQLPHLRPSVLYVFGSGSVLSPRELQQEKMELTGSGVGGSGGVRKGRVKSVVGENYGHLIPLEAPQLCARVSAEWIAAELKRWAAQEADYKRWTALPEIEKVTVSEEYKKRMGKVDARTGQDKPRM
ncbi:hypothetical protein S7711_05197 [Stachybotrys chartarum IBT 7711]|uniref:AB hydrolase-1 domain-containing protein n=1 Tax=Stachybotrys chartarum (strain CBS 109288 / IBT 7711) TaxID=1280523 RepID=A0A084ANG4_STACB|nr:hypothetical protein S7711_05197 [Stachybotrys chartarum IBT 7711]